MTPQHHLPADIERTSLSIITAELDALGLTPPPETAAVLKFCIAFLLSLSTDNNLSLLPEISKDKPPPCMFIIG